MLVFWNVRLRILIALLDAKLLLVAIFLRVAVYDIIRNKHERTFLDHGCKMCNFIRYPWNVHATEQWLRKPGTIAH